MPNYGLQDGLFMYSIKQLKCEMMTKRVVDPFPNFILKLYLQSPRAEEYR